MKKHLEKQTILEFIKMNAAGFVFFWTTYLLFYVFKERLHWEEWLALAVGSAIANVVFFLLDKHWVFSADKAHRKTTAELTRFVIFMTFNYFLNIVIILELSRFGITPYIGQFLAAAFFTLWTFVGLKWWVFKAHKPKVSDGIRKKTK